MTRKKWDRHAIIAEVHRRGETLANLSRHAGIYPTGMSCMLSGRRWPKAEKALAQFLGVPVEELFPDRYRASASISQHNRKSQVRKVKNQQRTLPRRQAA